MTVREILTLCAKSLQKDDLSKYLSGTITATEDLLNEEDRLLSCYKIIVSEIASEHLPVTNVQTLSSTNNKFYFSAFSKTPIEINAVYVNDKKVEFMQTPLYLYVNAPEITVSYNYYPSVTSIDQQCVFSGSPITERVIAFGVLREYLLMSGLYEEATIYDERFKNAITSVVISKKHATIKARSWY